MNTIHEYDDPFDPFELVRHKDPTVININSKLYWQNYYAKLVNDSIIISVIYKKKKNNKTTKERNQYCSDERYTHTTIINCCSPAAGSLGSHTKTTVRWMLD